MLNKLFGLLWSTKVALVLLVLILIASTVGVLLPPAMGKGAVFSSLWFNALLVLLIVNIIFCIIKRIRVFRTSKIGTTIFHLSLVLLFSGVVYDQLFFFEGASRLTEGETLSFDEPSSYDWARKGRFFKMQKLDDLGRIYLDKFHLSHFTEGRDWGGAYEIALGADFQQGRKNFVFVNHPLKYKGFELYRDKEGYSPLFVLRDRSGRVLYGAYAPLQSIKQKDGTYLYTSGSATAPGSFNFPQDPKLPSVFKLQTIYHPDKVKKRAGDVFFHVWPFDDEENDTVWNDAGNQNGEKLFEGTAALGETVKAGDYLLSMDEVRYWASMKVIYRPGEPIIFASFWLGLGGLALSNILKMMKGRKATNEQ